MATNNYKPSGQLVGNTSTSKAETDTAANPSARATAPLGAHPTGTKFIGVLEGSDASTWNRAVLEVARNVDRARYPLHVRPIAMPTELTSSDAAELGTLGGTTILDMAPAGSFDGWLYHGSTNTEAALSKLFSLRDTDGTLVLDSTGVPMRVESVKYVSGGANAVGVVTSLVTSVVNAPINATDARHRIGLTATPVSTEATLGANLRLKGCRVTISGSAPDVANQGSNNGNYVVVDGTSSTLVFDLGEYRHRIRMVVTAGTFASGQVITGSPSGATATIAAAGDIGSAPIDWIEFDSLTSGSFAGDTSITSSGGATATVIRYTAPADPVILNNAIAGTTYGAGSAVFKTDGLFSRLVKVTFTQSIPGSADRYLIAGTKVFLSEFSADSFLQASTGFTSSAGLTEYVLSLLSSEIAEMKGTPTAWTDKPMNVVGNYATADDSFFDLNTAFNRYLAQETTVRGYPSAVMSQVSALSGTFTTGELLYERVTLAGTVLVTSGFPTVTGVGTAFLSTMQPGSLILIGAVLRTVLAVASNTTLAVTVNFTTSSAGATAYTGIEFGVLLAVYASTGGSTNRLFVDVTQGYWPSACTLFGATSLVTATHAVLLTIDGRTILTNRDPVNLLGWGEESRNVLDVSQLNAVNAVRVRGDGVSNVTASHRSTLMSLSGGESYSSTAANGHAPASVLDVRVPVYDSATNVLYTDNYVGWSYAASETTITFRGNVDLTTFQASAAFNKWATNSVLVEIYESGDLVSDRVSGLYVPEFVSATTLKLKRLDATGYHTSSSSPTTGTAKARFWARSVFARGYYINPAGAAQTALLGLNVGDAETGVVLVRRGGTLQKIITVLDNTTERFGITVDQAAGTSDDADYVDAPTFHTTEIRSSTGKRALGADGTRIISLASPGAFYFKASPSGGGTAEIISSVLHGATVAAPYKVRVSIPTGAGRAGAFSIGDEWYALVEDLEEGLLRFMRLPSGGDVNYYPAATMGHFKNVSSYLKVHSPTISVDAEVPIGNGDFSSLLLGKNGAYGQEFGIRAEGNATAGFPDITFHTSTEDDTFMRFEQNTGTQSVANSVSKRPLVKVADIAYGADYSGYLGKQVQYSIPLMSCNKEQGSSGTASAVDMARLWRSYRTNVNTGEGTFAGIICDLGAAGEGSAVWTLPPYGMGAYGGSTEAGTRYFQSATVTCNLQYATDEVYIELLRVNITTGDSVRVGRKFASSANVTTMQNINVSFEHRNAAVASGASTITLGAADAPNAVAIDNYDQRSGVTGNYVGWTIEMLSGASIGEVNTVDSYNGSIATVNSPWGVAPGVGDKYRLYLSESQQNANYRLDLRLRSTDAKAGAAFVYNVFAYIRTTSLVSAP